MVLKAICFECCLYALQLFYSRFIFIRLVYVKHMFLILVAA